MLDLDAGDMRVPVVVTSNTTGAITIEGTNLYTDTEFANGANYFRVYRRDSAVGNPFGFAGGWLVSGNYEVGEGQYRSVKQLWYFWNRHYEPEYLLRWLQPDPIGPWGDVLNYGGAQGYVHCSPLLIADTSGLIGLFFDGAGQGLKANTVIGRLYNQYDAQANGDGWRYSTDVWPNNIQSSISRALERLKEMWCKKNVTIQCSTTSRTYNETIVEHTDLFGWSRGGIAALTVAQRLREDGIECCKRCPRMPHERNACERLFGWNKEFDYCIRSYPPVRFLDLIDPVGTGGAQMLNTHQGPVPNNVQNVWIGYAGKGSGPWFNPAKPDTSAAGNDLSPANFYAGIDHRQSGWDHNNIGPDLWQAAKSAGVQWSGAQY